MPLSPSSAPDDDREYYTSGGCHVFALALHRQFGWTIHLVLDQDEPYWVDPMDEDNWIPSVVHVYAVDEQQNAWDVHGVRPLGEVAPEISGRFRIGCYDSDELRSEEELKSYVGHWADEGEEPIDRPLEIYDEDDVDAAMQVAMAALGHLPDFPASYTPAA